MVLTRPSPTGYRQDEIRSRLAIHWRARDLSLTPVTGQSPTFSRASTASGYAKGANGRRLYYPVDERPVWHMVQDADSEWVPSLLLQAARTNSLTQSADLTHADWTATNLSARTADQASDPEGGSALDELVEDSTASVEHGVTQGLTLTADATYALSVWAIANTRTVLRLQMEETAAGGNNVQAWFDLSAGSAGTTGANGTGTFTRAYVEDFADAASGLYRVVLVGSVGNGATGITARIALADADGSSSYNGDGSSSLYAGFAQLEDDAQFASSYIPTTTAAASRSADSIYWDYEAPPQAMTAYCKFVERGTVHANQWQTQNLGTNQATDPKDFSATSDWVGDGAFSVSQVASIFDGEIGWKHTNLGSGNNQSRSQQNAGTLTGSPETFYAVIENVDAVETSIGMRDNSVGDWVVLAEFDWSTRSFTVTASGLGSLVSATAHYLGTGPNGGDLFLLAVTGTPDNPGSNRGVYIYVTGRPTNTDTSTIHYARHEEAGYSPLVTYAARLFHVGSATVGSDPRLTVVGGASAYYSVIHDNGTTAPQATLAAAPSIGDTVEIRAVLNADGSVEIGQSINGAAETTATDSTAATLASAWADTRIYLNGDPADANIGHNALLDAKVALGVHSMADMRQMI